MFDMKNALELSKLVIHFIIIMHTVIWEKKFEINHYWSKFETCSFTITLSF